MLKLVVLSSVLAIAASKPSVVAPLGLAGWAGPFGAPLGSHVAIAAPIVPAAPVLGAHNYRGPYSLAPGQPANILAVDGRPLDTLSVNLDRAVHYTAKAYEQSAAHYLGKRSAPVLAPAVAWSHAARVDFPAGSVIVPAHFAGALGALRAPFAPLALGHAAYLAHH